jgi:glycosidase
MQFWLETKKVDGLRIDAVKFVYENEEFDDEPLILENLDKPVIYKGLKIIIKFFK